MKLDFHSRKAQSLTEGSQIIDDDFVYALRVYRDKLSKAVRIQTSVHKGEMDR